MPDGHFHVFIFSKGQFYALYNGEKHFQIRGLVAELHVFEYGGTKHGTIEKTCFNVEDFYVKTIGWGYKIIFLTTKHGKVVYFHVTD